MHGIAHNTTLSSSMHLAEQAPILVAFQGLGCPIRRANGPGDELQAPPLSWQRSAAAGLTTSRLFTMMSSGPRAINRAEQHQRGSSAAMPS